MVGQASRGTGAANPGTRSRGNVPVAGPAGAAAQAQLGYWGTATALATTGGTYAAAQNLAEQGGEMIFGGRDHIDWGLVAKAGAINAASFVGGVVGGNSPASLATHWASSSGVCLQRSCRRSAMREPNC
jgi:hypothetical protein